MIPVLTAAEMRSLEQAAIAAGTVTPLALQERAAEGAAALVPDGAVVEVLAGPGNNGGDALAVARLLKQRWHQVRVWALAPDPVWKGDAGIQAQRWRELGGEISFTGDPAAEVASWNGRWVVDGLFGIGLSRPLSGLALAWIEALQGQRVLALDLPSGWFADAGDPGPGEATLTACFGFLKPCHVLEPARSGCGEIHVVDLGLMAGDAAQRLLVAPRLPELAWDVHKRQRGHVAIRAGSLGMSGAAVMAAWGALRVGAGLVTVLPDPEVRAEVAGQLPEAMVRPWEGAVPDGVDVLLAGPGGVAEVPAWQGPLILDASALGAGRGPAWMARPDTILTPHPGEFRRLFGLPAPAGRWDRLVQARGVATGPGVLLLKGPQSLICGGSSAEVWINDTGHAGLATGGTGDFLAGMVAGFRAQGLEPKDAAASAACLHGLCADRLGPGPLMVRDLADELAILMRELHG